MQQLMFLEPGRLEWQDTQEPALEGPGEALVRPIVVANCDLDRTVVAGKAPIAGPFPIGHEFVAEVVEIGSSSPGRSPAASVSAAPPACRRIATACPIWRCTVCPSAASGDLAFPIWFACLSPTRCWCRCRRGCPLRPLRAQATNSPLRGR